MSIFKFLFKKSTKFREPFYINCYYLKNECLENTSVGEKVKFYPREPYRITLILNSMIGQWSEINHKDIYNHLKKDGVIEASVEKVYSKYSTIKVILFDEYISEEDKRRQSIEKKSNELKKKYNPKSKFTFTFFCKVEINEDEVYSIGHLPLEDVNLDDLKKSIWLVNSKGEKINSINDTFPNVCLKVLRAINTGYKFNLKFSDKNHRGANKFSYNFIGTPIKKD